MLWEIAELKIIFCGYIDARCFFKSFNILNVLPLPHHTLTLHCVEIFGTNECPYILLCETSCYLLKALLPITSTSNTKLDLSQ